MWQIGCEGGREMELKEAIRVLEERAKYAQSRVLWCIAHQEDEGNLLLWETAQKLYQPMRLPLRNKAWQWLKERIKPFS